MNDIAEPTGEQAGAKLQRLLVELIEADADTQSRDGVDEATVADYAEILLAKPDEDPFPPIDVMTDGAEYWIGDGWHRYFAYLRAGRSLIPARLHVGTLRGARLFAAAANKSHGLKRTNADKRRAVLIILNDEEWRDWSDRRVADHCGVGNKLVGDLRRQLCSEHSCEEPTDQLGESPSCATSQPRVAAAVKPVKRVGKDGKARTVKAPAAPARPETVNVDRLSAIYRVAVKDLNRIAREFKAAAEKQDTGGHLAPKVQRILTYVADLKGTIRMAEPVAVCGKCNGKIGGCQHCARTGFWPRIVIEGIKGGERLDARNAKRNER